MDNSNREIRVKTWEDGEAQFHKIMHANDASIIGVIFRGQASAKWPLNTTLERYIHGSMSFEKYYRIIASIKPAVETFTNSKWDFPEWQTINNWVASYDAGRNNLLAYDYLAHLRHNGFPSPLLDWSASPYVAAFFAFLKPEADNVAIYAYSERPNDTKVTGSDLPQIKAIGPIVKTHHRHYRQQSRYTMCGQYVDGCWHFAEHQKVLNRKEPNQDVIWKIMIPRTERIKVLSALSLMNVNKFSLFNSEESLMDMLAVEKFDLEPAKLELRAKLRTSRAAAFFREK